MLGARFTWHARCYSSRMRIAANERSTRKLFRARAQYPVAALLALALGCSTELEPSSPPNVLLISIDTLRADHLSCYGYDRATSPELDRFAQRGAVFERAFSTTSWTLPAHLSMLTGLPISAHGICDDRLWTRTDAAGTARDIPLRGRFISESLQDVGYRCAGYFTWKYLEAQFGFGPGFETWERLGHTFYSHPVVGPRFDELQSAGDTEALKALVAEYPQLFDDRHPSSPEVVAAAQAWLTEHAGRENGQPFFLFLHLFDVHDPYVPPAPFDQRFNPDYTGPIDGRRITSPDSPMRADMPQADLDQLVALYDGEIAWVDSQLAKIFATLDSLELADDTLVVITSDHGEEFFEHGHKTHRRQLYTESTQVPLIVVWPGHVPPETRIRGSVGITDIAPTLRAVCGAQDDAAPLLGTNLVELASEGEGADERTYLSELNVFDASGALERQLAIVQGSEHWILRKPANGSWITQRFDLERDPGETEPHSAPYPDAQLERLRRALTQLRRAQPARAAKLPGLSERDRGELAAMGYSDGDTPESSTDSERLCLDGCVWE